MLALVVELSTSMRSSVLDCLRPPFQCDLPSREKKLIFHCLFNIQLWAEITDFFGNTPC